MIKTRKGQRGAVAVEFAFVFPVLLTLLGMMSAIGLGLKARHRLLTYASSAARYCAFQRPGTSTATNAKTAWQDGLPNCVNSYVSFLAGQDSSKDTFATCVSTPAAVTAVNQSSTNTSMNYLVVKVTCDASWFPIVGAMAGSSFNGTTYQVAASSAMPFLGPQPIAIGPPS